ncbi:MAG: type I-E CRISPR-associated protein Cse2/CasB [Methanocalculus sp.]|uniref:type I-E CRISPR-associated protein Cse2/CasB n=1 Tax=Methanocalculus sp. TaxID=2004547 RepID=UPI002724FA8F|nr:type I-E CRISPR-associated protein Cse2/CasB [Methanocalculus sp.]MDO8841272.1 type I-E CRISPR-associated protein Cse2/CasB [Methanocalculus sp.]MDO9538580.1 type I-E CRISPR-associated protein Cse2/CasB [Methanocalculus sp.]
MNEQKPYINLNDSENLGIIQAWWQGFDNNRGERADLRRCHSAHEVMLNPAYHRLRLRLSENGEIYPGNLRRLAILAGVLAHVREGTQIPVAEQLGRSNTEMETTGFSEIRFRRILQTEDPEDLFMTLIRMVQHQGGKINIRDLSYSILNWNERTREQWAMKYYTHAPERTKSE